MTIRAPIRPGDVMVPRHKQPSQGHVYDGAIYDAPWPKVREPGRVTRVEVRRDGSRYVYRIGLFTGRRSRGVKMPRGANKDGWYGWPSDYHIIQREDIVENE